MSSEHDNMVRARKGDGRGMVLSERFDDARMVPLYIPIYYDTRTAKEPNNDQKIQ